MTPTSTGMPTATVAASTTPGPASFQPYTFANNLLSDLGPLLALFGDLTTKQFLALSLGWSDNIILAVAPIGLLTIVVSAIRVAGRKTLKTLIGRARENPASAEEELLSSTSDEVCELWSGQEIVRASGQPQMKEIVCKQPSVDEHDSMLFSDNDLMGLQDAIRKKIYRYHGDSASERIVETSVSWKFSSAVSYTRTERTITEDTPNVLADGASNLTLNVENAIPSSQERWLLTLFSVALQSTIWVMWALITYRWKGTMQKDGKAIPAYGYPCTIAGATAITTDILLCAYVIRDATVEINAEPEPQDSHQYRVLRVQKACIVKSQNLGLMSYVTTLRTRWFGPHAAGSRITRSVCIDSAPISDLSYPWLASSSSSLVCGSATAMQVGSIIVMTIVRASLRRGLVEDPNVVAI